MGRVESKRKRRSKILLKVLPILILLLLPFLMCLLNPWVGICNGRTMRLTISLDETEIQTGSNSVLRADVTLKNKGPMLLLIEDPDHFNSRRMFIELPDGDIVELQIMASCSPELVFFTPFKTRSWEMDVGGPFFNTKDNEFEMEDGFRFNETGTYKVWAEYCSDGNDEGNDHLPPPIDRKFRSNIVQVKVE
jgi:hypothetical protein